MIDVNGSPEGEDEELSALLSAELDKAEGIAPSPPDTGEPEPEETEAAAAQRARDEQGRFAKKAEEPAKAAAPAEPAPVDPAAPVETAAVDPNAATRPPPGWSPAAKAAFDHLPPEVRSAVAQREVEINQGFAKLAEYKGLEPLADLARQNGTNLVQAVNQYRNFEVSLQQDFLGGITQVCQRFGVHPAALANAILARSGAGQQGQAQANQPATQPPDIAPILQRLQRIEEQTQQQEQAKLQGEIQKFAAENRYFENVRPKMSELLKSGQAHTIPEAYEAACWITPEVRAQLIKEQGAGLNGNAQAAQKAAAATQARAAVSKPIKGAPTPGAASQRAQPSVEDDLRAAYEAAEGSV
jgi:transposase-like protein